MVYLANKLKRDTENVGGFLNGESTEVAESKEGDLLNVEVFLQQSFSHI